MPIVRERTERKSMASSNNSKKHEQEKEKKAIIKPPIERMTKNEVVEEAKTAQQAALEAQAELERLAVLQIEINKLNNLKRHINRVQDAVQLLAERLMQRGEVLFAKKIVANSMTHDLSKFTGIEWEYLVKSDVHVDEGDGEKLKMAVKQHVTSNDHHPECWGSIDMMSEEALAEMVCDMYSRASEAGTDLRQYIKNVFAKKYNLPLTGKTYKRIKKYVDLLLDTPLKPIKIEGIH